MTTDGKPGAKDMSFLLPSKYTLETAPKPTDPRVRIEDVPPRTVAVSTFSGTGAPEYQQEHATTLLDALGEKNVKVIGSWSCARYNPPFALPFLRTNEIHVPIDISGDDEAKL
jgi:hypothetical protein